MFSCHETLKDMLHYRSPKSATWQFYVSHGNCQVERKELNITYLKISFKKNETKTKSDKILSEIRLRSRASEIFMELLLILVVFFFVKIPCRIWFWKKLISWKNTRRTLEHQKSSTRGAEIDSKGGVRSLLLFSPIFFFLISLKER